MAQIQALNAERRVDCAGLAAQRPLVLLALGQSNAGNHGSLAAALPPVYLVSAGQCVLAADPLPGATGRGGSIWQRLPAALSERGWARPVVLSVLAVDATTLDDWTHPQSPLGAQLAEHVRSLNGLRLAPDFVLWQQGEADAKAGTEAAAYAARLDGLAVLLRDAGSTAPIFLARSTVCRSPPAAAIRASIEGAVAQRAQFRLGPDIDVLGAELRHDGCHLAAAGLDRAAQAWAEVILTSLLSR
ncbi:MAG: hypothetical protein JNM98_05350 [Rhodocyclaceae bacterium]|nr:hypothetical protein [Rhodocyclaceae bacterium]